MTSDWLTNGRLTSPQKYRLQELVAPKAEVDPRFDMSMVMDTPLFFECLSNPRNVLGLRGDALTVEIRMQEDAGQLRAGDEYAWLLTQRAAFTRLMELMPVKGKRLMLLYLQSRKKTQTHREQIILPEAEGRDLLKRTKETQHEK